jgi:N-acetylmuramoyl-L-alanine amidase
MSNARRFNHQQAVRRANLKWRGESRLFSLTMLLLLGAGVMMGFNLFNSQTRSTETLATPTLPEIEINPPVVQARPTTVSVSIANISAKKKYDFELLVGIVSGHKGYDPGAVCSDGLTEAEVNYKVALEVASLLERQGIRADVLDEFDERLTEYKADALVSIHADSCSVPGATGFKVARVTDSAIPEAEDQLVACMNHNYAAYTGLPQHPASITDNMTNYHAFREIDRQTAGAIIEIGFLLEDRYLLEYKPKIIARGVAAGILCFLESPLTSVAAP